MRCSTPHPRVRRFRPSIELLEPRQLLSTTYYVSPSGLDTNPGTSAAQPFQTLAAINALTLGAGDQVLLEGGQAFAGPLGLTANDGGTAASPIVISSYGTGNATINAGAGDGIDVIDTAGVDISNLTIVGTSAAAASLTGVGIQLDNNLDGDVKLAHVYISNVDVSGFGFVGIGIDGTIDGVGGGSGFQDVRITDSVIHANTDGGIFSYAGAFHDNPAPYGLSHANLYVGGVEVYGTTGRSGKTDSGNGIKLGNVDGATVEHCVSHDNGAMNTSTTGGPCGIWTYNSNAVVIQYNESYDNVSAYTDGGGFDLDGGVTNSYIQYNYSHDNTGAGILLAQFPKATTWSGNTIRYNVIENDARRNNYGGINIYSGAGAEPLSNSVVYGNTVYLSAAAGTSAVGMLVDGMTSSFSIYNNIFQVGAGVSPLVVNNGGLSLVLAGNDYWNGSAKAVNLVWLGVTYSTLAAFRTVSKTERLAGVPTGLTVEPGLVSPGNGGTLTVGAARTTILPEYRLSASSPLIDTGVSLTALGIDPGPTDFFGTSVPQGKGFDVGAAEWSSDSTTVAPVATTVDIVASPAAVVATGTAVTLTATVTDGATGTVTFALTNGTAVGTATVDANGTATITTTALPVGVETVSATYAGDATHLTSTDTIAVTSNNPGIEAAVIRSTLPTSIVAGTPRVAGRVTLSATNATGVTYSGKAKLELFLSLDGALDSTAIAVATTTRKVSLLKNHVTTLTVAVPPLPTTLAAGDYSWVARITTASGSPSISPPGSTLSVDPPTVTLMTSVLSSRLPTTATIGKRVGKPVTLSLSNSGNSNSAAPLTVELYLSVNGSVSGATLIGKAKTKTIVRPGRPAIRVSVNLSAIPATVTPDTYTVLALVTDAANNSAMISLTTALNVTA